MEGKEMGRDINRGRGEGEKIRQEGRKEKIERRKGGYSKKG